MSQSSDKPRGPGDRREATRHLVKASALVSGMGLLTKGVGLFRIPVEAAVFGATRAMDAFMLARQIPQAFSTWIEGPIRAAIVPPFTKTLHDKGEEEAWREASNILNTLALALVVICALLAALSWPLVRLVGAGFDDPGAWTLATQLAWIMVPSIFFSVLAVVIGSLQNVYGRQLYPALGRFLNGVVLLLAVFFLASRYGQVGYAWGFFAGAVTALLPQLTLLWRKRRFYRLRVAPFAPEVKTLVFVALPLFIGLAGTRIDVLVDFTLGAFLPDGHITIRAWGEMLALQATDLMLIISQAVMLPHFAHLVVGKRFDELRDRLVQISGVYLLFLIPVSTVLCYGAVPIVKVVFLRDEFTLEAATLASKLIPIIALGAPVYLVGQLFAQAHISAGDTRTPMWIGLLRVAFKIVVSLLLIAPLGMVGLVVSSTISSYLRTFLLWLRLPKEYRPPGMRLVRSVGVQLVAALAAGVAGWALLEYLPLRDRFWLDLGRIALASGTTLVLHILISWVLGESVARQVFAKVSGRLAR